MKQKTSLEEAIKSGVYSKKVMQMAREELGENTSRRKLLKHIDEVESRVKQ